MIENKHSQGGPWKFITTREGAPMRASGAGLGDLVAYLRTYPRRSVNTP
jgi:hypothetical protein